MNRIFKTYFDPNSGTIIHEELEESEIIATDPIEIEAIHKMVKKGINDLKKSERQK